MKKFQKKWNALTAAVAASCGNERAAELACLCLVTGHHLLLQTESDPNSLAHAVTHAIADGACKIAYHGALADAGLDRVNVVAVSDLEDLRFCQLANIVWLHSQQTRRTAPYLVIGGLAEHQYGVSGDELIDRFALCDSVRLAPGSFSGPVVTLAEILEMRSMCAAVHVSAAMTSYLRRLSESLKTTSDVIPTSFKPYLGNRRPSVRELLQLADFGRVKALAAGRDFVAPEDVKPLVANAVCHRLGIGVYHERNRFEIGRDVAQAVLERVPLM